MKERIKEILESQGLNATQFAQKVNMNVSALSHILSGRNNPGYDALQKIIRSYPQINIEWLMTGQGEMFRESFSEGSSEASLFDENPKNDATSSVNREYPVQKGLKSSNKGVKYTENQCFNYKEKSDIKIRKIAVFYTDNTYEEFFPLQQA